MRDALTLKVDGLLLHGTSHSHGASGPVGVLFLNSGSLPRSSRGDLYVHTADHLAERGFKCFRVDLPGLGDSQGDVPPEYVDFYKMVQEGTYAGTVAKVGRELRRIYGLSGLVLAGICGGAQTSVFAAAKDRDNGVAGLILLDMPFFLYQSSTAPTRKKAGRSLGGRIKASVARGKGRARDWVLSQKWEPQATKIYYGLKRITSRANGSTLPPNTNHPLLKTLIGLLDQGVPALVITAHPLIPEPKSFDYIGYLTARAPDRLEHAKIMGTTHSFVENEGAKGVQEAVAAWLAKLSPRT